VGAFTYWSSKRSRTPCDSPAWTGLGYSPAAELIGSCAGTPDRFKVTLTDRAGERTFWLDLVVARPGRYEGRVRHNWGQEAQDLSLRLTSRLAGRQGPR